MLWLVSERPIFRAVVCPVAETGDIHGESKLREM
jgi:hypothetical protein